MGTSADYARWIVANADKKGTPDFDTVAKAYQAARASEASPPASAPSAPAETPHSIVSDPVNAVVTGFNRGLVGLAGLPADTLSNVIDLGKSAIGSGYIAATGKAAPKALDLVDRKNVPLTSDWINAQLGKTAPTSALVNTVNPEYQGGYLQNAGAALAGAATVPGKSVGQVAQNVITGQASAAATKAVGDATGNPSLAIAAGLTPLGVAHYGAAGIKAAVRGGEQGRRDMQQRVQDLANAGVTNPTVGLASGNTLVGGLENILANTPGAMNVMAKSRTQAVNQLRGTTEAAADAAAPASLRGSQATGQAINKGINAFTSDFKDTQQGLYNKLDKFIPQDTPATMSNTTQKLDELNADIEGAPNTSVLFKNARIAGIGNALSKDLAANAAEANSALGSPPASTLYTNPATVTLKSGPFAGTTKFMPQPANQGPPEPGTLPYEALKKTRTLVGNEIADAGPMSDVPRSKWRPLYGALSEDMQTAANKAGGGAPSALSRANAFTRAGIERLENIEPFASSEQNPEQSFHAVESTLSDNASMFSTLKKSLPEGTRGQIAGTVIEKLGKAAPGQQNESGDAWSTERFLTNWNRMSPEARDALLSGFPNSDQVTTDVNTVAKAASMMRDNSKLWANPSGTAANIAARGALMAPAAAVLMGHPMAAVGAGGLMGAANLAARGLTSKAAVNAIMSQTQMTPEELAATLATIRASRSSQNAGK